MYDLIFEIAWNTPWWVYVIFAVLILGGLQATKQRVTSLYKLSILPIVFCLISIESLSTITNGMVASGWALATLLGLILGWMQVPEELRINKKLRLIELPGSWSTLCLALLVFSTKYYFGYALEYNPDLLEDLDFVLILMAISGFCSGLYVGRFFCYSYRIVKE